MNPVYDFSADDHATMLGDQVRLEAYHRAISNTVKPGMVVVEIGTGTGILSAFAAMKTKSQIYALEYFENTAALASCMMKGAGFDHVKVLRGESYDITVSPEPEILITETIGAIGPEENIVELCYDFKKRHPKIHTLIPADLKIFAEPICSKRVKEMEQEYFDYFASASFGSFDYKNIHSELGNIWSSVIRFASISDSRTVGECQLLAEYKLGVTEDPAFEKVIDLGQIEQMDAVHLYFETRLDSEVSLSTHYSEPVTHWRHAFVTQPKHKTKLTVMYSKKSKHLEVLWS